MGSGIRLARLGMAAAVGLACSTTWGNGGGMIGDLAYYCTTVLPAGIGSLTPVTTATPAGTWQGTSKCEGKFQGPGFSKLTLTIPVTVVIADADPYAIVCNRFAGIPADLGLLPPGSIEGVVYTGAYFPDAPGATKGTLGFGTDLLEITGYQIPYLEAGQAKLEGRKDGTVTLKGKSYTIADSYDFNGAVSAVCEWKLEKTSDQFVPPIF